MGIEYIDPSIVKVLSRVGDLLEFLTEINTEGKRPKCPLKSRDIDKLVKEKGVLGNLGSENVSILGKKLNAIRSSILRQRE